MNDAFTRVISLIDAANAKDPNKETDSNGEQVAKEILYSKRMTDRLALFEPSASEHLKIAVRAQHIERWTSPRSNYPEGPAGYKLWRSELGRFHADRCAELMTEAGYGESDIQRVKKLITKRGIKSNPECQVLEDVICLVFLEYYLADFVEKHERDKVISIIRKTWAKMSDAGHTAALSMQFPEPLASLVGGALSTN